MAFEKRPDNFIGINILGGLSDDPCRQILNATGPGMSPAFNRIENYLTSLSTVDVMLFVTLVPSLGSMSGSSVTTGVAEHILRFTQNSIDSFTDNTLPSFILRIFPLISPPSYGTRGSFILLMASTETGLEGEHSGKRYRNISVDRSDCSNFMRYFTRQTI